MKPSGGIPCRWPHDEIMYYVIYYKIIIHIDNYAKIILNHIIGSIDTNFFYLHLFFFYIYLHSNLLDCNNCEARVYYKTSKKINQWKIMIANAIIIFLLSIAPLVSTRVLTAALIWPIISSSIHFSVYVWTEHFQ